MSVTCKDHVGPTTVRVPAANPSRSDPETSLTATAVFNREFSNTTKRNPLGVVYIHQIAAAPATRISNDPTKSPTRLLIQRERRRVAICDALTFICLLKRDGD